MEPVFFETIGNVESRKSTNKGGEYILLAEVC